jgi:hypothetical protein
MGGSAPSANSQNVRFAYDLALQVASKLYQLSRMVDAKHDAWTSGAGTALRGWEGPHADHFRGNKGANDDDARVVVKGLQDTANFFARKWAEARGEQDRINWARWVEAQQRAHDEDAWFGESAWDATHDFFFKTDYGEGGPPPDPPIPTHDNDFAPTRSPMHTEYGP